MTDPTRAHAPSSPGLADHTTPLIRDEWYVAAWSRELGPEPVVRTLLGIGVLLYRTTDGLPVALRDRCPHRSLPLSRGRREGDDIVCGYHGLTFGPDGACIRIPSQSAVPAPVRAQAYAVVERGPLVWIWMGERTAADPTTIPDHPWLDAPDFTHIAGYLHVRCNYVRLHENVLDLTHFPFLHGAAVGDLDYAQAPFEVARAGDTVSLTRKLAGHVVNAGYGAMIGNIGHRVDRSSESWFLSPAFHIAHATIKDLDGGVEGRTDFHFKIQHMFTPETATSTHYFWAAARDVNVDDQALSAAAHKQAVETFLEDVDALEQIESVWSRERETFAEISVAGDRAGLLMRRIIARRAHLEAEPVRPAGLSRPLEYSHAHTDR